jgi:hypothetical protein
MDWQKNKEIVEKYNIKRTPIDMILPVLITILFCYIFSLLITVIAGQWFNIRFYIDTIQIVAGFGVVLSLLAFAPRLFRAKHISDNTKLEQKHLYSKSELKSKLSQMDIIVFCGSMLTILTSLLLTPLY